MIARRRSRWSLSTRTMTKNDRHVRFWQRRLREKIDRVTFRSLLFQSTSRFEFGSRTVNVFFFVVVIIVIVELTQQFFATVSIRKETSESRLRAVSNSFHVEQMRTKICFERVFNSRQRENERTEKFTVMNVTMTSSPVALQRR